MEPIVTWRSKNSEKEYVLFCAGFSNTDEEKCKQAIGPYIANYNIGLVDWTDATREQCAYVNDIKQADNQQQLECELYNDLAFSIKYQIEQLKIGPIHIVAKSNGAAVAQIIAKRMLVKSLSLQAPMYIDTYEIFKCNSITLGWCMDDLTICIGPWRNKVEYMLARRSNAKYIKSLLYVTGGHDWNEHFLEEVFLHIVY